MFPQSPQPLPMKTNLYSAVIAQAAKDFTTPGKVFSNPYYPTSPNGDAYLLTYWALYWGLARPDRLQDLQLAPSRGNTWKVNGHPVRISGKYTDYRNGPNFTDRPLPVEAMSYPCFNVEVTP